MIPAVHVGDRSRRRSLADARDAARSSCGRTLNAQAPCHYYDLAKVSVNRLAYSQGHELESHGCTAVSLTPGWLRSDLMLENFGVTEANWRDAINPSIASQAPKAPPGFAHSESPRYVGCTARCGDDREPGLHHEAGARDIPRIGQDQRSHSSMEAE
jgi:hypothetical protein